MDAETAAKHARQAGLYDVADLIEQQAIDRGEDKRRHGEDMLFMGREVAALEAELARLRRLLNEQSKRGANRWMLKRL